MTTFRVPQGPGSFSVTGESGQQFIISETAPMAGANRIQFTIDYSQWLKKGETLTSVVFTVSGLPATVDTITYNPEKTAVQFFLNNNNATASYTIAVLAITTFTQQRTDQVLVDVAGSS